MDDAVTAHAMPLLQPTLTGETILVRPMQPSDVAPLYEVARDPRIWEQHPESTRWQPDVFARYAEGALASGGGLVVTRHDTGELIGASRYYDWTPEVREVAIGFTFLVRTHWGGATNSELKRLMLAHAFTFADRVWFHVGERNVRSRRAVEKLGATVSHLETGDHGAVTLHYLLTRAEWTRRRAQGAGAPETGALD